MNWRKLIVPGLVLVVIIGFAGILVVGMNSQETLTGASGSARVNKPAVDFTIKTFDGGEITLSGLKGSPVVVNFWASWCPPCKEEAAVLERGWKKYRDKGVTFIGVNIQDKEENALAFIREYAVSYPNGPDPDGRITIDYGVGGIPVTFFIDREGVIVSRWVGAVTDSVLSQSVEEIMK